MATTQAQETGNFVVNVTLGCLYINTQASKALSRKTFSFHGFETQDLAQKFGKEFDTFLHAVILRHSLETLIQENIWLVRGIQVRDCCRSATIVLQPSNNFRALLNEMFQKFEISLGV